MLPIQVCCWWEGWVLGREKHTSSYPICRDESFDFVYSINVLEHAQPWQKLLLEMIRVLRPGGLLYLQYHPIWWSPKGHHMGVDMVWTWIRALMATGKHPECNDKELAYANDGSVIPDWAHLLWDRDTMQRHLESTRFGKCPGIVKYVGWCS